MPNSVWSLVSVAAITNDMIMIWNRVIYTGNLAKSKMEYILNLDVLAVCNKLTAQVRGSPPKG